MGYHGKIVLLTGFLGQKNDVSWICHGGITFIIKWI